MAATIPILSVNAVQAASACATEQDHCAVCNLHSICLPTGLT